MTDFARIIVHRTEILRGRHYDTYSWQGKPHWPVIVSGDLEFGADYWRLPWPLKLVEREPWNDYAIYVRADIAGGWWARLVVARRLAAQAFAGVYARLIVTAMVWGCAHVPMAEYPTWRHLKWPWKK